jgi:hypothetical protein
MRKCEFIRAYDYGFRIPFATSASRCFGQFFRRNVSSFPPVAPISVS